MKTARVHIVLAALLFASSMAHALQGPLVDPKKDIAQANRDAKANAVKEQKQLLKRAEEAVKGKRYEEAAELYKRARNAAYGVRSIGKHGCEVRTKRLKNSYARFAAKRLAEIEKQLAALPEQIEESKRLIRKNRLRDAYRILCDLGPHKVSDSFWDKHAKDIVGRKVLILDRADQLVKGLQDAWAAHDLDTLRKDLADFRAKFGPFDLPEMGAEGSAQRDTMFGDGDPQYKRSLRIAAAYHALLENPEVKALVPRGKAAVPLPGTIARILRTKTTVSMEGCTVGVAVEYFNGVVNTRHHVPDLVQVDRRVFDRFPKGEKFDCEDRPLSDALARFLVLATRAEERRRNDPLHFMPYTEAGVIYIANNKRLNYLKRLPREIAAKPLPRRADPAAAARRAALEKALAMNVTLVVKDESDLKDIVAALNKTLAQKTGLGNAIRLDESAVGADSRSFRVVRRNVPLRQILTLVVAQATTEEEIAADPLRFKIDDKLGAVRIGHHKQLNRK